MGNQKALLIFDAFWGQTTDKIFNVLKDKDILVTKVPANMTHLFQLLDLTVNKATKDCTKQKFSDWFICKINTGLENGQKLDDIEIDYWLSVLKQLHAKRLITIIWLARRGKKLFLMDGKDQAFMIQLH